ncbi:hypothetical protein COW36_16320 [bacterium (Candidatus Blackallbacteria) CG17_big_fil_post_rev_8_21_14_2_50_48_46]|uniref:SMP-30/Gluconolactonase/LRE-like region domain-containing protein n=1 Tax=bacterium (Candidatus Blackallbacteria) CG17_big_fil_post_rev_8_21_14_2_50_48_46 TaxID=2014261 RepID=A0A2M7G1T8_9BACT|nr:MAG: hypothetical protein COW64_16790 [bacterium (Candidatus Blackallbacteria) CG18_big_fil_WC_8_21_14_2_50_49_26]PIW15701.1 MAG: hypothetical protein COW36_16320 [bacterium (Candidatus Blackallbacteria) CG17_big_fil_post_rev_8_21_14_2_50_48_46]PIW48706.1 MAG: hypothetical protein COW20_08500 [bacterium (Candidatus Blackallbacteria) CG13_big_fil_rev_8_21_14_2_50_49_14]
MSSRLDYQSPEFTAAVADAQSLQKWTESHFQSVRSRLAEKKSTADDLLACAELSIRLQDANCAQDCLEKQLKARPSDADAFYLKAMLALGQGQKEAALQVLENATRKLSGKSPDNGRVWRLLAAERLHQKQDLSGAAQAMVKACEQASAPAFLHSSTRPAQDLTAAMLNFDFSLFDQLFSWEDNSADFRLSAVANGPLDQLYILDSFNRRIFEFDAQGQFQRGIDEHQLSAQAFLHPESRWELTDLCIGPDGKIYLAGNQDKIGVFSPSWEPLAAYASPAGNHRLKPLSLTVDAHHNLYVIYQNLAGIHVFNAEGFHEGSFGENTTMPGTDKNYYCGLACLDGQKICLYDREKVQIFEAATRQLSETVNLPQDKAPNLDDEAYPLCWNGIGTASNQRLWLADTAHAQIMEYRQGKLQQSFTQAGSKLQNFSNPFDISIDSQGCLYLADTGNARVLKYKGQEWTQVFGHPGIKSV